MYFKNIFIYRLPPSWQTTGAELESLLQQRTLQPCTAFDMATRGWVAPGPVARLVESVGSQHLIALGVEEKLLPSSIVAQVAAERAKKLAEEQGYPLGRRQLRELKERVTDELRAKALVKRRATHAWIDTNLGLLVVNAAGESRADELISTLRDTLGSLPVHFIETGRSPQSAMAAWLTMGDPPLGFTIDEDLELVSVDKSKSTVRYARHALDAKEIPGHLSSGKQVARLGLCWRERLAFDNDMDRVSRGRSATGDRNGSRKYPERLPRGPDCHAYRPTDCRNGHPLSSRYVSASGERRCTECQRQKAERYRAKKAEAA